MKTKCVIDAATKSKLVDIYNQIMWLARLPKITSGEARSWYTHVMARRLRKTIRKFSGKVSRKAIKSTNLRLEHYKRIQTSLTKLVEHHKRSKKNNPNEFVKLILECENVHIVTFEENYQAMKANGDYKKANIHLVNWNKISKKRRIEIWSKVLKGKVSNAEKYKEK